MERGQLEQALKDQFDLGARIPLSGVADGAAWLRARTRRGGEPVVLYAVSGEAALETADAARRASLVDEPHLLPVEDVIVLDDAPGGPWTVVRYPMPAAPPLAAMLGRGRIRPETARSIIGEAATGVEAARRRGLRHQHLDSNRIFVDTASGTVQVLGVGVEAASHRTEQWSSAIASYEDVTALVALLYRAMSAVTPQRGDGGRIAQPSSVVDRSIPSELDTLCDVVLNGGTVSAPANTKRLIEWLGAWQSIPATLAAFDAEDPSRPAADNPVDVAIASAPVGHETEPSREDGAASAPPAAGSGAGVRPATADASATADAPASAAGDTDAEEDEDDPLTASPRAFPASLHLTPAQRAEARIDEGHGEATVLMGDHSDAPGDQQDRPIVVPGRARSLAVSASTTNLDDAWGAPEQQLRTAGGAHEHGGTSRFRDVVGIALAADEGSTYDDQPEVRAERDRHAQWILLGALVLVILALVIAITSVTAGLRRTSTAVTAEPSTTAAASATTSAPPAKKAAPTPSATSAPAAVPPKAVKIEEYSQDHPDNAGKALDGNPATAWKSKWSKNPDPSLRSPDGLGLIVDLEKPSTLTRVVVHTGKGQGGLLQLRAVNPDGTPGAVLAQAPFADSSDVTLAPASAVPGTSRFALTVAEAPALSPGKFGAEIAEVRAE